MLACQSAGRPPRRGPKGCRGGKSGLHGPTVPDNVRRGLSPRKRRSAPGTVPQRTDRLLPLRRKTARVKRCGKSAPRDRQRNRHGKPHREQDRIGAARARSRKRTRPDRSGSAARVGCLRRRVTGVPEEWPSRAGTRVPAPYRTRLIGWLTCRTRARRETGGPSPISAAWRRNQNSLRLIVRPPITVSGITPLPLLHP